MNALIISAAQDTNGGNIRMKMAADRWGNDESILRILAIGHDDPAGVVGRYKVASDKLGGLKIRSAARASHYFDWPTDIVWRGTQAHVLLRQLADEADLIHLNNSYRAVQSFGIRKPMLLHHHGTMFRNGSAHMMGVARHFRMQQAVSTIDLQKPDPKNLPWLPTAYNVDELVKFGQEHRREPDGRVRVIHCPTSWDTKQTPVLIAAVAALREDGLPVDLEIIGPYQVAPDWVVQYGTKTAGMSWAFVMERKAQADILYDQLAYGYGCNAVEAWAMGVPVIAGADDWTLAQMAKEWGGLPFVPANESTLELTLRRMVTSPAMRQDASEIGHAHVRTYHDERPALAKLAELYAKAIKGYTALRIPGKGQKAVTFRSTKGQKVYDIDGSVIAFEKGEHKTADPIVIQRLRYFTTKRPSFGIVEVAS